MLLASWSLRGSAQAAGLLRLSSEAPFHSSTSQEVHRAFGIATWPLWSMASSDPWWQPSTLLPSRVINPLSWPSPGRSWDSALAEGCSEITRVTTILPGVQLGPSLGGTLLFIVRIPHCGSGSVRRPWHLSPRNSSHLLLLCRVPGMWSRPCSISSLEHSAQSCPPRAFWLVLEAKVGQDAQLDQAWACPEGLLRTVELHSACPRGPVPHIGHSVEPAPLSQLWVLRMQPWHLWGLSTYYFFPTCLCCRQ